MRYYLSTKYHEYSKNPTVCGIKVGKPIDTIELISISIVSEKIEHSIADLPHIVEKKIPFEKSEYSINPANKHSKEYYAICKEFDLKAAWNNEWLRENVLKSIFTELVQKEAKEYKKALNIGVVLSIKDSFIFKNFKHFINKYGKTRKQIADEIIEFVYKGGYKHWSTNVPNIMKPEFYAYYADYDWVCLSWLYGRMINLPSGFPMYCKDLKQELDSKYMHQQNKYPNKTRLEGWLQDCKNLPNYPKQTNEHNALADAKWNKELYNFLNTL